MNKGAPVWECYQLPGILRPDGWREVLEKCLETVGCPYRYDILDTSLRIWDPNEPEIKVPDSAYTCRNGYKLQRVAFGRAEEVTLVGISLTRLVFEPGSKFPAFFSTDELFSKGNYPEILRHQPMIAGIKQLIKFFNDSLGKTQLKHYSDYIVAHPATNIRYHFGNCSPSLAEIVQNSGLSKNLLNAVKTGEAAIPASVRLGVLSGCVQATNAALNIGREIVRVLHEWQCHASLKDLGSGAEIEAFLSDYSQGQPVVLVPLEGRKGVRPPNAVMDWLKYFDSEKAAFQLCSTTSNPLYSRHGLAIAVLAKANGSIFVTEPDNFPNFRYSWFVGLDMGRGGYYKGKVLAITLTSPEGILQAHWRASKNEDETLPPEVLSEGLSWITSQAELLAPGRHIYLIRDGLRPHNESTNSYREAMSNRDFTLIEYSKSGSPLIHCAPLEPEPGTTILLERSDFTVLYPCISPQRGILTIPVKFRTPINPNGHSPSEIASLLTALCHSATLSYQPSRLPAPLQWANGLARLSYTDLQFCGWSHRAKKLMNLAAR